MTNVLEYRLKQLQEVIYEAEQTIKNASNDIDKETLQQRKLFLKKCKDEEKEILQHLGIDTTSKTKNKSKNKTKKENTKEDKNTDKKADKK